VTGAQGELFLAYKPLLKIAYLLGKIVGISVPRDVCGVGLHGEEKI
jgi:hypothetical protein